MFIAQLDRASDYGSEGCEFESYLAWNLLLNYLTKDLLIRERI